MRNIGSFKPVFGLVMAPGLAVARRIARCLVQERLAACVNLFPGAESHYWWRGKIESAREVQIVIKTSLSLAPRVEKRVIEMHPYDTPEFVLVKISGGNRRYLDWWKASMDQ